MTPSLNSKDDNTATFAPDERGCSSANRFVIWTSPPLPSPPVVIRTDCQAMRADLEEAIHGAGTTT